MLTASIIGWALIATAAVYGLRAWWLDQRLQAFRTPGRSGLAYLFVPIRWQRALYTAEGQPLVGAVWRATALMYGLALLGMLLIAAAQG